MQLSSPPSVTCRAHRDVELERLLAHAVLRCKLAFLCSGRWFSMRFHEAMGSAVYGSYCLPSLAFARSISYSWRIPVVRPGGGVGTRSQIAYVARCLSGGEAEVDR
jgi:hypothetical protein